MSHFTAPQELHDLAFRYALAVDTLDENMIGSIFTRDGAVLGFGENPIEFRGADGFARLIAQVGVSFQRTMHNVFNQSFEQAEDGAVTGQTTCVASHILPGDEWNLLDMAIRYHNVYAREDGLWKFAERRLEVIWVETRPVQKFSASMMQSDPKEFR